MILVIGAGVAGLSATLAIAAAGNEVQLVTNSTLDFFEGDHAPGNTALAQGGIAAALGRTDSVAHHTADTLAAGVGLVDPAAATILTTEGAARVQQLIAQGFAVDLASDGSPALGLEAAHSHPRIVHAGEDRTGAGLFGLLCAQMRELIREGRVQLREQHTLNELITHGGRVSGAILQNSSGSMTAVTASAVVLATGGYAGLWSRTSNHPGSRGNGVVCAARAGALVSDLEFVQFHPTVLADTSFLISEAVRGAGAVLRDRTGSRFMVGLHAQAELAPRDVVSREIHRAMQNTADGCVWLDATGIERSEGTGTLARRFPKITQELRTRGYEWSREVIPVAPAAHYTMGGVATDLCGRTTLPGLFAAGEVAATGVHGANRLASNSLLEGLVFGQRAGAAAVSFVADNHGSWRLQGREIARLMSTEQSRTLSLDQAAPGSEAVSEPEAGLHLHGQQKHERESAQHTDNRVKTCVLDEALGIERSAASLDLCIQMNNTGVHSDQILTFMIAEAASARTESRGSHQRADYPHADPEQARRQGWFVAAENRTPADSPNQWSYATC